ncbi:MAG: hypothetical protein ACD_9C00174G0005 [uncultured bacterium]|nr:MAG: hypothetical protein ACD_9C00174G0005 [uncultured bacterium]
MNKEQKEIIINFLRDQITQADFRTKAYAFDETGNPNPKRNIFIKLNKYVTDFLVNNSENRWIMLTGLRGAGKTTLLSQIYQECKKEDVYRLYVSVDQITQILNVSLHDFLSVYEEILGMSFEQLDKPLFLFLDEVQYDEKWGIILKSIYDRSKKIFILATGSSALHLNSNADIARRAKIEKLFPLSFCEYVKIKNGKKEIERLSLKLRNAIFESRNAKEVFDELIKLQPQIRKYWMDIDKLEMDKYIRYGSLPFMVSVKNEAVVYDLIKKNVERIINTDVASQKFTAEIVSKIPSLLYIIAGSDTVSFTKLAQDIEMSRPKIMEVLETIEKTELLNRVYPYGSHVYQVNKPSKYLFSSPAFRSMYFNFIGSINTRADTKGKLLEDAVGMYMLRYLQRKINVAFNFDYAEGGADFVLSFGNEKIVVEVGSGSKGYRQVEFTSRKVKPKYGLVFANDSLSYSEEFNTVRVPLEFLFTI